MLNTLALYNEMIPYGKLIDFAERGASDYASAAPYPHAVLDEMFDPAVLDAVLEEFDRPDDAWHAFDTKYEKKMQLHKDQHMGPMTRAFIHNLNSEPFLEFLEKLTGITGLIPDPYLVGAGCHKIPRGGKLGIHVDFNTHKRMGLARRLNVLVYLNKDWKEEYGGHFELWDDKKATCKKRVLPIYNRMAIFSTTDKSFHGHPEPLNCPEDRQRKSIALYYYTIFPNSLGRDKHHSTVFMTEDGKKEELGKKSLYARLLSKGSSLLRKR